MGADRVYYERPGPVAAAAVALPVLAILAVCLRFYVRIKYKQGLKTDDWVLIPAALATLGFGIDVLYGVVNGAVGYPTQLPPNDGTVDWLDVQDYQITLSWLVQWSSAIIFSLDLALIKASFVALYLRIFSVMPIVRAFLISFLVILCLWGLVFFFVFVFDCRLAFWANYGSARVIAMNCLDTTKLIFLHSITSFIFDIIIVITPIPLIWQLNLRPGKKLALCAVFLLGAVASAASLIRVIMLDDVTKNAFKTNADGLLASTQFLYWTLVECGVGLTAACLPTFGILSRAPWWAASLSSLRSLFRSRQSGFRSAGSSDSLHAQAVGNSTLYQKQSGSTSGTTGGSGLPFHETRTGETMGGVEMRSMNWKMSQQAV
ncbi:hypothetical protein F5X97DRAFT_338214 [Nemania serpens]|nr:hypothetical protein F5X97DRAFT_338214 [Nemania serpens]